MRVWLVTIGEPIPIASGTVRLLNTGLFAEHLSKKGNEVVWWNSDFDHGKKRNRFGRDNNIKVNSKYNLKLLHGRRYKNNIGIARLINHKQIANKFKRLSLLMTKPDVIVTSFPPISLCTKVINYAKDHHIPVLIYYRDLWPEAFINAVPKSLQFFVKLGIKPFSFIIDNIFRRADGIMGITQPFLELGLIRSRRSRSQFDNIFPLAYPKTEFSKEVQKKAKDFWDKLAVFKRADQLRICFFVSHLFHRRIDIETVIKALILAKSEGLKIQLIACGNIYNNDPWFQGLKKSEDIIFPGFIDAPKIQALMKISEIGLLPYKPSLDFNSSIPNKVIEYFSESIPVLTPIEGYLKELLSEKRCGLFYQNGDVESLLETLKHISKYPGDLKKMGMNAKCFYDKELDTKVVFRNYEAHLKRVVENYE